MKRKLKGGQVLEEVIDGVAVWMREAMLRRGPNTDSGGGFLFDYTKNQYCSGILPQRRQVGKGNERQGQERQHCRHLKQRSSRSKKKSL
jgi:hypothetical protein